MKKTNRILVITGGVFCIVLALFHLTFWELFNWETELEKLSAENSNIMQMLNIVISVIFISYGVILIFFRNEILNTRLGKAILASLSVCFLIRFILGFVLSKHEGLFSVFLLICTLVYLIPWIYRIGPDKIN